MARKNKNASDVCALTTEGVEFTFRWSDFPVGGFLFIPCVATTAIGLRIHHSAKANGITVEIKVGVQGERWGVGVSRVL